MSAMIFITNKYTNWYYNIITNAQARTLPKEIYVEKHHIIPKSLGGSDSIDNLVRLTAREHFICHWLLYKMVSSTNKSKMANAWFRMCQINKFQKRYTSRNFELARIAFSKNNPFKSDKVIELVKERMTSNNPMKNPEIAIKVSTKNKGKRVGKNNTFYGKKHSVESIERMSKTHTGKTMSKEAIQSRLDTIAKNNKPRILKLVTCPRCGLSGKGGNMSRYHFDNCVKH